MKRILVAGCALIVLAVPAPASAALDANCPGPTNDSVNASGTDRYGQLFTALSTGNLVRARTEITKNLSGTDWVLEILAVDAAGIPTNTVLAVSVIPDGAVPFGQSTFEGTFSSPAVVLAGKLYFLTIRRDSGLTIRDRGDNPCPGQEFFSNSLSGSWNGGGVNAQYDWVYSVFVDPPEFKIGKQKGRKLKVIVPVPGQVVVTGAGQANGNSATAAAKKPKLLRKSKKSTAAAGTVTVKLRLSKAGRARLRKAGKLKAKSRITFKPTGGIATSQKEGLKFD